MKFKFLDILLFALLFIFVVSFPVDLLGISLAWQYVISIILKALLLTYNCYILWRNRINIFKFANYKRALLFIPFLLACFSNLIAIQFSDVNIGFNYDPIIVVLVSISTLLTAINEEFLFRFIIQSSLIYASSLKRIVVSALIFGLFHLLKLVDVRSVTSLISVLVQVLYTFGLGLILGLMYEYTYSLPLCIFFHLSFNMINNVLITDIFSISGGDLYSISFYLTSVVVAAVLSVYGILIYIFVFKNNEKYFRE